MIIVKVRDYEEMSKRASEIVIEEIKKKPNLIIGLPTGKTPLDLYKGLIKEYRKKKISFSKVRSFNLDEYYPISKKNKNSFYYYMFKNFFNKANFKRKNINLLNGESKNWKKECRDYEKKINKLGIDLMILGIGKNGHIAFNEPGSSFNSKTRLVKLSDNTKKSALTIGLSTIMKAKKIILLASGKNKAFLIKKLIDGKINRKLPASILKKHKNSIVIIDKEAGKLVR